MRLDFFPCRSNPQRRCDTLHVSVCSIVSNWLLQFCDADRVSLNDVDMVPEGGFPSVMRSDSGIGWMFFGSAPRSCAESAQ